MATSTRQHDVADFAMGMNGCWEARNYSPEGFLTLDAGLLAIPLPMPLNAGDMVCLQQSVERWRSETRAKMRCALSCACSTLQSDTVSKDVRPVKGLAGTLCIPVYTALPR